MHNIKSITQKDRYGNMFSLELFEDQSVPLMIMIPDAPDGFNGADTSNHPGDPKGTDTVPAWLTPGENVVNAEASRLPGNQEKIDKMNEEGRKIQKAQGGPIPTYAADGGSIYAAEGYGGEDYQPYEVPKWFTPQVLESLIQVESSNNNKAVNPKSGATGAAQIMADTALDPGYNVQPISLEDRNDPEIARQFATQYIAGIQKENPNYTPAQVLQAYNAGPGRLAQAMSGKGDPLAQETIDYPTKILGEDYIPPRPDSDADKRKQDLTRFNIKAVTNNLDIVQSSFDTLEQKRQDNISRGLPEFKGINQKTYEGAKANVDKLQKELADLQSTSKAISPVNTTDFVNKIIAETDTGDEVDQPTPDADTNDNVVQAGVDIKNNNPGFFKETTDLFLEVLGDMFPPKDLARMVINYAGSRALGYDHNGSLNYTMKDYATRAELERVRQAKFVNDNEDLYTPESLNEYLKSGDVDVLVTKTETSGGITGQSGTRFDRLTGLEVPVYTIGTGDDKRLVTQGSNGQLLDLSKPENRIRFEVMNDSVHNPTNVTNYFQKALNNRTKEINKTIDDANKQIDFATDELAGESYLLYEETRNTFGMDTKQSQRLKNEIVAAQGDYLKAIKSAKESGTREPTSLEGYYNKRVISLKTKGIISYNDVKNTSASNMDQLEQTLLNIAADAANGDQRLAVKTYRDLWSSGKETWNNMKSKGRFTEGKTEGYDPFIAWMQAVVVGDETATKLEDPSNMKK